MRFALASTTGVPVTPTGSISPHGSAEPGIASPRCVFHTTAPSEASSKYTLSFSVAITTPLPTSSGWAYISPSRFGDTQRVRSPANDAGPSDATPLRALSPKYVTHPPPRGTAGVVAVVFGAPDVVTRRRTEGFDVPEPPAEH